MLNRALQIAGFVVLSGSPLVVKAGELETLRARCAEQERQIRELEKENAHLRETGAAATKSVARPSGSPAAPAAPAAPAVAAQPAATATTPATPAAPEPAVPTYRVKQGDTYYSIGKKFKVSPDALQAANPKVKATALRPGLVIRLAKADAPKRPAPPPPVQTSAPEKGRMAAAESPGPSQLVTMQPRTPSATRAAVKETPPVVKQPSAPSPIKPAAVPVKQAPASGARRVVLEDSIRYDEFAQRHGTTVQRLNALNNLNLPDSILLAKGADLMVPAQPIANSTMARP